MGSVFKRGNKGSYYIEWNDHAGFRKSKSARTTDKGAAERILGKIEAKEALRREGVINPALEELGQQSIRPIEEHVAEYEAKLKVSNSEKHVSDTAKYIRAIVKSANWQTIAEIRPAAVDKFSGVLQDLGRSSRTRQAYLRAIKGFTKHLAKEGKLPRDPLIGIKVPQPGKDRKYERRALLPEEWPHLESAAINGPTRNGMAGPERALLYRVAIQTGLRAAELRSLTRKNLFLGEAQPYIVAKSKATKNGKLAKQYILPDAATALKDHLATNDPKAKVFNLPEATTVARMLQADLKQARSNWLASAVDSDDELRREQSDFLSKRNHDSEVLDFHSLRHTCGAWLVLRDANPKVVQSAMRHSTITLTMDTYGHLFKDQGADAISRLQELMPDCSRSESLTSDLDENPNASLAEGDASYSTCYSKHSASPASSGASACDSSTDLTPPQSSKIIIKPDETRGRSDPMRSSTMPCYQLAPLAQLAEQLTLNQ